MIRPSFTSSRTSHALSIKGALNMPSGRIVSSLKKSLATACSLTLVLQSTAALAADVTTYTYDQVRSGASNIGQLTTLENPAGKIEKDYDANGNVTRQTWRIGSGPTYEHTYTYAPHGQLLRQKFSDNDVVPSASQVIQYNGHGELNAIPGLISGITRAATSEPLVTSYANGVTETRTYHAQRQWLFAIVTANSSETLFTETYVRDTKGLIKEVTSNRPHGNWTYGYDGVDRLISVGNSTADYNQTLTYNAADNITSNSAIAGGSYTYPAPTEPRPHAVTQAGGQTYTYDLNGNLLTGGGRTIQYDGENRPTQITALGQTTDFKYGPDGARLTKTTGGQTTIYLGSDEEITPAGERIKHPAPGVRKAGSEINWLQRDHLSSVRLMTNASGAVIAENHFRPYGARTDAQLAAGVPRESKGWIGERDDPETGLTFLNARYYDPVLARFISPDWFDPKRIDVGTNRYAYGLNNPVVNKDPSGNFALLGAAIGAVVGIAAQAAIDAYNGEMSSVSAYGAAAVGGAVTGATAGLGAGVVGVTGASIGAGALGGASATVAEAGFNGEMPDAKDVALGAGAGALGGAAGAAVGNVARNAANSLSNHAKGVLGEGLTKANYGLRGYVDTGRAPVGIEGFKTPTGRKAKAIFDHNMSRPFSNRDVIVESKFGRNAKTTKNQNAAIEEGAVVSVSRSSPDTVGGLAAGATGAAGVGGLDSNGLDVGID
ncbi:RHS repeat domain-containing protein [Roseibium alexandrii]